MEHDILPDLLAEIQADFEAKVKASEALNRAKALVGDKKATYATANAYATELGEILSEALRGAVTGEKLPDGKMYHNIAKRLLEDRLGANHEMIADYAGQVQALLNQTANIGLAVQSPEFNRDRLDGLVNRLDSEDNFDEVSWLLHEPIVNFSQAIVDDFIKANADFHARVGLSPEITRRESGNCCEWCKKLVGTYKYPSVPDDVWRRHQRCRCTVEYDPKTGKKQDAWSRKWR